jgi:plastocyanin
MRKQIIIFTAIAVAVTILALPAIGFAALPSSATMQYGQDRGSGCNPPDCFDDQSFHADDRIIPGAVSIAAGGTVFFDVQGFHQVAIYAPGTKPKDITPAGFFVDDPTNRINDPLPPPTQSVSFTFDQPGKYLVICNVAPHFEEAQMWGWVQVN